MSVEINGVANGNTIGSPRSRVKRDRKEKEKEKEKDKDKDKDKDKEKKRKRDPYHDLLVADASQTKRTKCHRTSTDLATAATSLDTVNSSAFHQQTRSLYLALSPISQLHPLEGICAEHLSPLILTYYPPFEGVVLAYSNPRLSEAPDDLGPSLQSAVLAKSVDEYAASFVWVTADFLLFRPQKGGWIEGWVNLQNDTHIGLVCWNLFNASIERRRLPREWQWVGEPSRPLLKGKLRGGDGEMHDVSMEDPGDHATSNEADYGPGYFQDGDGKKIEGALRFMIREFETSPTADKEKSFLSIEGTFFDHEEEVDLGEQQGTTRKGRKGGPFAQRGSEAQPAEPLDKSALAVVNGQETTPKTKHRHKN